MTQFNDSVVVADIGPDKRQASRRSVAQSVDRALALLRELAAESTARTVQDLSQAVSMDRTVVHRLLKTLAANDMVVGEGGSFRLGPQTVLLANAYVDAMQVRRIALPYMVDMQAHDLKDLPWTVSLSIPVGSVSTVVERIWTSTTPLDVILSSGDSLPLMSTATGRSILAHRSRQYRRELLGDEQADAIEPLIEATRAAGGIGISRGEAVVGLDGLGMAICNRNGEPVAALAVAGVELGDQLSPDSRLAHKLTRNALAIGRMVTT